MKLWSVEFRKGRTTRGSTAQRFSPMSFISRYGRGNVQAIKTGRLDRTDWMSSMKQRSFNIRSLMIAIASYGIALTVIRWLSVRSPHHVLLFSLGPLCGVGLHRLRGGNGIVGGAVGGIAAGFVFVAGHFLVGCCPAVPRRG